MYSMLAAPNGTILYLKCTKAIFTKVKLRYSVTETISTRTYKISVVYFVQRAESGVLLFRDFEIYTLRWWARSLNTFESYAKPVQQTCKRNNCAPYTTLFTIVTLCCFPPFTICLDAHETYIYATDIMSALVLKVADYRTVCSFLRNTSYERLICLLKLNKFTANSGTET